MATLLHRNHIFVYVRPKKHAATATETEKSQQRRRRSIRDFWISSRFLLLCCFRSEIDSSILWGTFEYDRFVFVPRNERTNNRLSHLLRIHFEQKNTWRFCCRCWFRWSATAAVMDGLQKKKWWKIQRNIYGTTTRHSPSCMIQRTTTLKCYLHSFEMKSSFKILLLKLLIIYCLSMPLLLIHSHAPRQPSRIRDTRNTFPNSFHSTERHTHTPQHRTEKKRSRPIDCVWTEWKFEFINWNLISRCNSYRMPPPPPLLPRPHCKIPYSEQLSLALSINSLLFTIYDWRRAAAAERERKITKNRYMHHHSMRRWCLRSKRSIFFLLHHFVWP